MRAVSFDSNCGHLQTTIVHILSTTTVVKVVEETHWTTTTTATIIAASLGLVQKDAHSHSLVATLRARMRHTHTM